MVTPATRGDTGRGRDLRARWFALVWLMWIALGAPQAVVAQATLASALTERTRKQIDSTIDAHVRAHEFSGVVLITERGAAAYQRAVGLASREWRVPMTQDAIFRVGSTTKQFTAVLVMQLVEQGRLRLDGTVSDYLPDYPKPQGTRITIAHLLSHSSGIPDYVQREDFFRSASPAPHTVADLVARFRSLELEFEPGSRWNYSNSGYVLLTAILEQVTGERYAALIKRRLADPLGLASIAVDDDSVVARRTEAYFHFNGATTVASYVHSSSAVGAGNLRASAGDLARWGDALMAGRVFANQETTRAFLSPRIKTGVPLGDYAFGLFVGPQQLGDSTVTVLQHGGTIGGYVAGFWMIPSSGRVIVVLTNTRSEQSATLVGDIAKALYR